MENRRKSQQMEAPAAEKASHVLVVGGTGTIGEKIVHELCCGEDKEKFKVVTVIDKGSPNRDTLSDCKCEIIECNADSVDDAVNALQGKTVRQVVMALRADDHNQERLNNWLQAVQQLNAEYVLLVSEPRADRGATILGQQFNEAEKQLKGADINWTIVRTNFFTDNLLFYAKDIKSKKRLALPVSSEGSFAPILADDAATAVCTILTDCQKHHGQVYELTGSKTKTGKDLAQALSGIFGDEIKYQECSVNELRSQLKSHGLSDFKIDGIVSFYDAVNKKEMTHVTDDFSKLTGKQPAQVEDYLRKHQHLFTEAREA